MASRPNKPSTTGYNQRKKECERRKENDRRNEVPNMIAAVLTLGVLGQGSHNSSTCPFCKRGTCNE